MMDTPVIIDAHSSYVLGLLFTRDGKRLVSSGMDNLVKLWSVHDWKLIRTFEGHDNSVNSISLSPDEKMLATGSSDMTVKLWSFPEGKMLHSLQDRKKVVSSVTFSQDGQFVASGSYGGRAVIWTRTGQRVVGIKASQKNLSSVAISPDGKLLATSGLGETIAIWSLPSGELYKTLSGDKTAVGSLKFIEGGRSLVSLGYEKIIKFWDTRTWQEVKTIRMTDKGARSLVISPDEKIAALGMESKVQLRSVDGWKLQAELPIGTKAVNGLAFSWDGRWLAVGAADRKIRVFDLA